MTLLKTAALGQQTSVANALFPAFSGSLMSPSQIFSDPLFQESLTAGLRPIEESTSRLLTQARRDAGEAGQLGGTRRAILESEVLKDKDIDLNVKEEVFNSVEKISKKHMKRITI